ncbi:hypothetical protein PENSPDRAFT_84573 [Peniophora sp. CONT]|nr:hypothetical protein PENSPDRAFT_84573 [Peniophora sp. CONT]
MQSLVQLWESMIYHSENRGITKAERLRRVVCLPRSLASAHRTRSRRPYRATAPAGQEQAVYSILDDHRLRGVSRARRNCQSRHAYSRLDRSEPFVGHSSPDERTACMRVPASLHDGCDGGHGIGSTCFCNYDRLARIPTRCPLPDREIVRFNIGHKTPLFGDAERYRYVYNRNHTITLVA